MPFEYDNEILGPEQKRLRFSPLPSPTSSQPLAYRTPPRQHQGIIVIDSSDEDEPRDRNNTFTQHHLNHSAQPITTAKPTSESAYRTYNPPALTQSTTTVSVEVPIFKRPRGRPRKDVPKPEPKPPAPRGRPRRHALPDPSRASIRSPGLDGSRETSISHPQPRPRITPYAREGYMTKYAHTAFVQQLRALDPPVTICNEADHSGPPTNFTFIQEYDFKCGTHRLDPAARTGCTCRPDNGRNIGCEYRYCECLEDSGKDEDGNPLGFPYHAVNEKKGCLRSKYLERRNVIYECNELCNCPEYCKNKVVQKGRRVPLEIFKTSDNRGWGLRCPQDLQKGEFVEVYLGEVIDDAEADRREQESNVNKDSYLFSLDKFPEQSEVAWVVDGETMGSPARFINHSCDPNLRIFVVSLVRGDPRIYELAFFAAEYIPAGKELTVDYLDRDDVVEEEEQAEQQLRQTNDVEKIRDGKARCNCGAANCRRWLWI